MRLSKKRLLLWAIGAGMLVVFISIATLGRLGGPGVVDFLTRYAIAFGLYLVALVVVWRSCSAPLRSVWLFAIAFRAVLLFSPPTLSDDVYRYVWDGHVHTNGINPYAYRVDAPELDALSTPDRALVNNAWMASPYLPVAQVYFAATYRLAPGSVTAFQFGGVIFDLLTGLFLMLALRRVELPAANVVLYLWNPLVIVEAAHGAHVDALMTMLMMAGLWVFCSWQLPEQDRQVLGTPLGVQAYAPLRGCGARLVRALRWQAGSAILLGLATLVKPFPALLLPILMWRWGWKRTLLYVAIVAVGIAAYAGAGLGLGELTGTGVFGATRIYLSQWNFNGGLFHWLEVALTGVETPGAVPVELAGVGGAAARAVVLGALIVAVGVIGWRARRESDTRALLRIALVPIAAHLLLATTVNPWYLIPLIALLPFQAGVAETGGALHVAAWLYFSAAVMLSYLTYLDPINLRETYAVRQIEYLPLYAMLIASALSFAKRPRSRSASAPD